jgi:hypothetical protein
VVAIPLLSGVRGSEQAEFVRVAPLNLEPVPIDTNLSRGQLRAAIGAVSLGTGPGIDRGGIYWRDRHFRVMGTKLVQMADDGSHTVIGDVGGTGQVSFDYSFDRLIIRSGTALFYYDLASLVQVTDTDLGLVLDALWVDGYTMTTDGTSVVVTELTNPLEVKPLKYGSAEEDPDPITGLIKIGREAHVLGRHTIQPFRNVGGAGFPFQTIPGATIPYGCVGASAKSLFGDGYAFVGSARNQSLGVFLAGRGALPTRISDRAVEDALAREADPSGIVLETRTYRDEQRLLLHLERETHVFLANATTAAQAPLWYRAQSGYGGAYRPRNAVLVGSRYLVGDVGSAAIGYLSESVSGHFGETSAWEFQTAYAYNEGRGGIIRSLELVGLPGRASGSATSAFMSMTRDGSSWSVERSIGMGRPGERSKRLQWRPKTKFANYMGFRFRGFDTALPGFARLEARIDPLGK